ncbi:MAG: hypothetical protein IPL39_05185 [Opitutaceae bacterium]|nr:hypothetical protein [Opitutaceae bacterium]
MRNIPSLGHARFRALTAALLLAAPLAHAFLDLNHDGLSDIWQAAYPTAGAANADPDGDGYSNALEQLAGTNPLSAASRPTAALERDASDNLVLRWPGLKWKRYYASTSPDLKQWSVLGTSIGGTGADLTKTVLPAGSTTASGFYRVNVSDADTDADLLTDWEEAQLGLSSTKADTDADGMDDFWESDHGTNPALADASADPDSDGFSNLREYAAGTDPQIRALPVPGGPIVFWTSQPVAPDETILATCAGTGLDSTAELARLPDTDPGSPLPVAPAPTSWTAVDLHTATPRSVTVTVPNNWTSGVYALRLKEAGVTGPAFLVNRPDPWFVQGDLGDTATPGGTLTIAGNCLEIIAPGSVGPRAALVRAGVVVRTLTAPTRLTVSTGYALRYTLPANLAEDDYQLYVHNGCGGPAGWVKFTTFIRTPLDTVTIKQATAWPTNAFTVAAPTGTGDDAKFTTALNAAAAAGGGIVHVPAGTYVLTQPLLLPHHTVLKGAGRDLTLVRWDNNPQVANPALPGLVTNLNYTQDEPFGLEDIAFTVTNTSYWSAVVYRGFTRTPTTFRRLRLTAPRLDTTKEDNMPFGLYLRRTANLRIEDVEIVASKGIFGRDDVRHVAITSSLVRYNNFGFKFSGMSHNLIVAGNTVEVTGPTNGNTSLCLDPFFSSTDPYCRDVLWINNTYPEGTELVSQAATDTRNIYRGTMSMSGTSMTLASPTITTRDGKPATKDWAGAAAVLIGGSGSGQWRYLRTVPVGTTTVTINRPWDTAPDANSLVTIVELQDGGYTGDGGEGVYRGPIAATNGISMTLAGPTITTTHSGQPVTYNWTGGVALILDGRGAGQWRYALGVTPGATSVTLDRPWDVAPDASSIVSIISMLGRYLMVDNDYLTDAQHDDYYVAVDSIKAGNRWGRTGTTSTATTWAGRHYQGTIPGWHIQFLGNTFASEGNSSFKTLINNEPKSDYDGVVLAAQVYRKNREFPAGSGATSFQLRTIDGRAADLLYDSNQIDLFSFRGKDTETINLSGVLLRHNTLPGGTTPVTVSPAGTIPGVTQK